MSLASILIEKGGREDFWVNLTWCKMSVYLVMNKLAKTLLMYGIIAAGSLTLYAFGPSPSSSFVTKPFSEKIEGSQLSGQRFYFLSKGGEVFRFDTTVGDIRILDTRSQSWVLIDLPLSDPATGENRRNIEKLLGTEFGITEF